MHLTLPAVASNQIRKIEPEGGYRQPKNPGQQAEHPISMLALFAPIV
jgi:hypothetical protein